MSGVGRSRDGLGGWLLVTAIAIGVLHAAGGDGLDPPSLTQPEQWPAWLSARDPVVASFAVLRLMGLAAAWYVLTVTLLGASVRFVSAPRLAAVVERLTIPVLRRVLVTAAGATLATGLPVRLAVAAEAPQIPVVAASSVDLAAAAGQLPPDPTTTTSTDDEGPRPPPTLTMRLLVPGGDPPSPAAREPADEPTAAEPDTSTPKVAATTWTVQSGECFWSIADDVLTNASGRPPSDGEIVPYWQSLIEKNRGALSDGGNPDLIFPGQVFTVPAPPPID